MAPKALMIPNHGFLPPALGLHEENRSGASESTVSSLPPGTAGFPAPDRDLLGFFFYPSRAITRLTLPSAVD